MREPEDPTTVPTIQIEVFGCTDVGLRREHNEDSFAVAELTNGATLSFDASVRVPLGARGSVFIVADGMGGAAAGELASAMAVETVITELKESWSAAASSDPRDFARALRAATDEANTRIYRFAAENPEHRGMGTTATIAGLLADSLFVAQVGDSRAYLFRHGMVRQITKDQSLMQRLVESGDLTPEEAAISDRRNIILQALGPEPHIRSDITTQQIRRGDTLLLCSDGLTGHLNENDIATVLGRSEEPEFVSRALVALANERGGSDNITVVVARFTGEGLAPPQDSDMVGYAHFTVSGESDATDFPDGDHGTADGEYSTFRSQSSAPAQEENNSSHTKAPLLPPRPVAQDDDLSRSVAYGILAAVVVGVTIILFRKLL